MTPKNLPSKIEKWVIVVPQTLKFFLILMLLADSRTANIFGSVAHTNSSA